MKPQKPRCTSGNKARVHPPHLHFDRLMAIVDTAAEGLSVREPETARRTEGRPPLSARIREPISSSRSGSAALTHPEEHGDSRRSSWECFAELQMPHVHRLQEDNRLMKPEAAGLRTPGANRLQVNARDSSIAATCTRPLSARANMYSRTNLCSADRDQLYDYCPILRPSSARQHVPARSCAPACRVLRHDKIGASFAAQQHVTKETDSGEAILPTPNGETVIRNDWTAACSSESFLRVVHELCSLGTSSKTDEAISRTRELVRKGLECEGCSVFLVVDENRLVRNSLTATELPETAGVVGRIMQGVADLITVRHEDTCDFFDQRVDCDPDVKTRMGKGLLAHGVFSSTGKLLSIILAVGKLHGHTFGNTDEIILRAMSAQLGMILGLCKTVRKMENNFKVGARDIRFAKALNECRTSDSVITLAKQYFQAITGATSVHFFDSGRFALATSDDNMELPVETAARAFKSGSLLLVEDMSVNPEFSCMMKQHEHAKSVMSVPMRVGLDGKILGVIQGRHREAFKFTKHEAKEMEAMLFMMTKVLERTQMSDNTLKLQTKLPKVFSARQVRDAIFFAEGVAREVLSAQAVCVFILNQKSNKIWTVHPTSSERDEFETGIGLVGECLKQNVLMQVPNALQDTRYFERIDGTKCTELGSDYRCVMLVPIRGLHDRGQMGVIVISRDQKQGFSQTDHNFAKVIAITLSAAFQVCMENEIFEVALQDNRAMMRIAASMHHKLDLSLLAHATILGTMEAMQASECIVLLRQDSDAQSSTGQDNIKKIKLRKFAILEGRLQADEVMWDDAVLQQSIIKGLMVNVTSQAMLNAIGYKRLHRLSAISGCKSMPSQMQGDADELLLGPTMCSPLFTGLDRGRVFGAMQIRRARKAAVFTESDEQKFRYLCQHASSAFRRTMEREQLVATIDKHRDHLARNAALSDFLEQIQEASDVQEMSRHITKSSKKLAFCAAANLYRVMRGAAGSECCSGMRQDGASQNLWFVTQVRMGSEMHDKKIEIDKGIPGQVHRATSAVLVNRHSSDSPFDPDVDDPGDGAACRNALGLPIFSRAGSGEVVAVLVLYNAFAKTSKGLGDRDFDEEDVDRMQVLTLWIALFLRQSRQVTVPVPIINTIFAPMLAARSRPCLDAVPATATFVSQQARHLQKIPGHVHDGIEAAAPVETYTQAADRAAICRTAAWLAVSDAVKEAAHCQAFVVFRLVSGAMDLVECVFPTEAAGHRIRLTSGILKQALDSKGIVNIHDSKDDVRVRAECDKLDFLNIQWDKEALGGTRSASPQTRYGDGKLSVRHTLAAQGPGQGIDWMTALVVPILDEDERVTGLAVAVNKSPDKGVFHPSDTALMQALILMMGLEGTVTKMKGHLQDSLATRRNLIKHTSDLIYKSSQALVSIESHVKDCLASLLKISRANYGAVYLIKEGSKSTTCCTKYDSQGSVTKETRNKSLPWTVLDSGSPINLAQASDVEASQAVPNKPLGALRSIMAQPLILDHQVQGAVLVAWKCNGEPFNVCDEEAIHDFAVVFAATTKLVACVQELVSAVELDLAIPARSIPPLSGMPATSPAHLEKHHSFSQHR